MYTFGNAEGPGSHREFDINVTDDQEVEGVETITLTGNAISPLAVFILRTAMVEILNSDGGLLWCILVAEIAMCGLISPLTTSLGCDAMV